MRWILFSILLTFRQALATRHLSVFVLEVKRRNKKRGESASSVRQEPTPLWRGLNGPKKDSDALK